VKRVSTSPRGIDVRLMKTSFSVLDSGMLRVFESRQAAAKEYNVPSGQIKDRLRLGWTSRQAVNLDPPPERPQPPNTKTFVLVVDGAHRTFRGYSQLGRYFNTPEARIRAAVDRGWSIEAAVGLVGPPTRPPAHNSTLITVQDGDQQLTFHGYSAVGVHYGKSGDTIRHRIQAGQSPEAAVGLAPPENKRAVTVRASDEPQHFRSLKAACRHFNKTYETVYDRYHNAGWTLEQALDLEPHPKHTKRSFGIVYLLTHAPSGKKYVGQTVTTFARRWTRHCIDALRAPTRTESRVAALIRRDGPESFRAEVLATAGTQHELDASERHFIASLSTLAPDGLNKSRGGGGCSAASGRAITVAGTTFPSESAAARCHKVNPDTFRRRLRTGKTPEQAAGLRDLGSPSTKAKPIRFRYRGKVYCYASRISAAKDHRLSVTCVSYRLDVLGWSVRRALTTPPDSNRQNKTSIVFRHDKKTFRYDSIRAAAKASRIKYATAKNRLRNGWSYRRAFTTPSADPSPA
jgi:hypothetical protein